jgi:hypothetical protein
MIYQNDIREMNQVELQDLVDQYELDTDYLDPDDYAGPLLWGGTYFSYLEVTVQS